MKGVKVKDARELENVTVQGHHGAPDRDLIHPSYIAHYEQLQFYPGNVNS